MLGHFALLGFKMKVLGSNGSSVNKVDGISIRNCVFCHLHWNTPKHAFCCILHPSVTAAVYPKKKSLDFLWRYTMCIFKFYPCISTTFLLKYFSDLSNHIETSLLDKKKPFIKVRTPNFLTQPIIFLLWSWSSVKFYHRNSKISTNLSIFTTQLWSFILK